MLTNEIINSSSYNTIRQLLCKMVHLTLLTSTIVYNMNNYFCEYFHKIGTEMLYYTSSDIHMLHCVE